MSKKTLASVARFAHLLGITPRSEEPKEDDPKQQRPDESDEDYAKRMEEEDAAAAAAAETDDDESAETDSDDSDEDDKKDKEDEKEKAARKAERARCAAIFACPAAASRIDMAAHLAFETSMSASSAVKMLGVIASGQPKVVGLASRMASVVVPVVGSDSAAAGPDLSTKAGASAAAAAAILAAGKKARGEKA